MCTMVSHYILDRGQHCKKTTKFLRQGAMVFGLSVHLGLDSGSM